MEKGADVNAQGGWYGNALQAASSEGHEQIVRLLAEKGADFNAKNNDGPIYWHLIYQKILAQRSSLSVNDITTM